MAESIRIAHDINPNSWSVYPVGEETVLCVGQNYVLTTINPVRNDLSYLVDSSQMPDSGRSFSYEDIPSVPAALRLRIPSAEVPELFPVLQPSHEAIVRSIANAVRVKTHRWEMHRQDMVDQIASAVGSELPIPGYAAGPQGKELTEEKNAIHPAYWKISAGRGNRDWPSFQARSIIALDWQEAGRLPDLPHDQQAFVSALVQARGVSPAAALSLWQFIHGMHVGDRVVSTARGRLFGIGTIVGDYETVDDDFPYRHRRRVEWTEMGPVPLPHLHESTRHLLSRQSTIVQLTKSHFDEIVGQYAEAGRAVSFNPLEVMHRSVEAHGLTYTERQLATFYAALQTKGFVILSGISGTGKSQLAQAFVAMMPEAKALLHTSQPFELGNDIVPVTIGKIAKERNDLKIPVRHFRDPEIPALDSTEEVVLDINGISRRVRFTHRKQQSGGRYARLYVEELHESIAALENGIYKMLVHRDDTGHVTGFTLGGRLDAGSQAQVLNALFLSVRPDWRDSRALLGYHNPLLGAYEWTEFLRFVLRAAENFRGPADERVAWFVILDEMNLAHVEYYFADLLSVLESGRDAEGWTREAIRIERPDSIEDQEDAEVPPASVRLPPNLYIIGTVNMDETTHAFSPKVLDRAFTIELSEIDFSGYPPSGAHDDTMLSDVERQALLVEFSRGGRFVGIDKAGVAAVVAANPAIRAWLTVLNAELARSRMQFGYRVFDEIATFVGAYRALLPESGLEEAFDLAVLMKILPKFSGSASRLERPLVHVLAWCLNPDEPPHAAARSAWEAIGDGLLADHDLLGPDRALFPLTARRVAQMLDTLAVDGFASFG